MDGTYGAPPMPPMDGTYGAPPMPPMTYYAPPMPPMDGTYGAPSMPPTDYMGAMYAPMDEPPPPMADCPVCIAGFTAAGGCGLLEDMISGKVTDNSAIEAAIPAGCEEAGDECGADALAECGMDPSMFDEPMPE